MTDQPESTGQAEPRRHDASFTVALRSGSVTLKLASATAAEVLEWVAPILIYLRRDAEENA